MDIPELRWRAARILHFLLIYLLMTDVLVLLGFVLFIAASTITRDVIHVRNYMNHSTYSTFQFLQVVAIFVASPLLAIPVTRWIARRYDEPAKSKEKRKRHAP